ncbi:hypothetical protein EBR03_03805 [bacterium]|nr:hypothetical protein [bacterium]
MRKLFYNQKGVTIIGASVAAALIGAAAVTAGIVISYARRAKLRAEAKVSVIDNESALSEVVAATLARTLSPQPPASGVLLTPSNFVDRFNAQQIALPDNTVTLGVVRPGNTVAPPTNRPQWFQDAANSCNAALQAPATDAAPGVYLFCLRLNRTDAAVTQTSTSFLDSELAFAQFRVELSSQSLPHQQKVFGVPGPSGTTLPTIAFRDWGPRDQQQLKMSYRIFWKRRADDQGYFQYMGSKMFNIAEVRI